jgi:hypothetical protein
MQTPWFHVYGAVKFSTQLARISFLKRPILGSKLPGRVVFNHPIDLKLWLSGQLT